MTISKAQLKKQLQQAADDQTIRSIQSKLKAVTEMISSDVRELESYKKLKEDLSENDPLYIYADNKIKKLQQEIDELEGGGETVGVDMDKEKEKDKDKEKKE